MDFKSNWQISLHSCFKTFLTMHTFIVNPLATRISHVIFLRSNRLTQITFIKKNGLKISLLKPFTLLMILSLHKVIFQTASFHGYYPNITVTNALNLYPIVTKIATSTHPYSLTRLYNVGWPTLNSHLNIP